MEKNSRDASAASPLFLGEGWFDPIEMGIRERIRGFIEELAEEELNDALGRTRYQRPGSPGLTPGSGGPEAARTAGGYRHGRESGNCSVRLAQ